jgi:uncharacterized membrane protein
MNKKVLTSAIIAGAVSLAAGSAGVANAAEVKCYGISKAGKNDCAGKTEGHRHSCAGQASVDYSYEEWKMASESMCEEMHGSLEPKEGINEHLAKTDSCE